MLDKLSACAVQRVRGFTPRDAARLVQSMGQLRYQNPSLLESLADHVAAGAQQYRLKHLHALIGTYAHFKMQHEALTQAVAGRLLILAPKLAAEEMGMAIEGLFHLGRLGPVPTDVTEAVAKAAAEHSQVRFPAWPTDAGFQNWELDHMPSCLLVYLYIWFCRSRHAAA